MRGKASTLIHREVTVGITPAYAGKSSLSAFFTAVSWDHPRLCGEKHPLLPPPFADIGSPPPMRGKGSNYMQESDVSGITPAYAGKSRRGTKSN